MLFFEKRKQYTEIFLCKREQQEKKLKWYFCVLLFCKREIVHRDFPLQKMPTRKEIEMIFLRFSLLKKVNSTQRFWFVLCISLFEYFSFEKGKRYTGIFLCKRAKRKEIEIIFLFLSDTILKKVHSTQRFFYVLFTFFKREQQEMKLIQYFCVCVILLWKR